MLGSESQSTPQRSQSGRSIGHQATRRAILDAAWGHADLVGIAGLSLREVARQVGMQAPSLYTYFPSKDAIFDAMFAEGYVQLQERMTSVLAEVADTSPLDQLATAAEEFIAFCQESPARYQLMFTMAVPGWEPSPEAYQVSVQTYQRSVELLEGLGISGEASRDLYTAVVSGLAAQQMANDPQGDRWRRLARPAMEMLLRHIDQEGATA